jgi:hypothetical protein
MISLISDMLKLEIYLALVPEGVINTEYENFVCESLKIVLYKYLNSRARWPHGLRCGFACGDCRFEHPRVHGYLPVVSVVCCPVEISVTGRSLVQRSPT